MNTVWRSHSEGLVLACWIQPRASRTEVVGLQGDRLKIRLAAPPVDGEANLELVTFLAKSLRRPKSQIEILSGHTGRRKDVLIRGVTGEDLKILGI